MKKPTVTASSEDSMAVSVSRFGHDTVPVLVPIDATVAEVLTAAGISLGSSEEVFVAGETATPNSIVEAGDVLSIVTPKKAGNA